MTRIGVISDTHSYIDPKILGHLENCDEIWHAGDIGSIEVLEKLESIAPVKAVYGNIDGQSIRLAAPEIQQFQIAGKKVLMMHIAGYPNRYNSRAVELIKSTKPDIFVCGHSHILKIIYDRKYNHLHINPGAAGKHGFQKVRTLVRFNIDKGKIGGMEVVEMGS